jgi:hypothetical protein
MSEQQRCVVAAINEAYRATYAPVTTVAVAVRCCMSDRWARELLSDLAVRGAIRRVGVRRGWMPAPE